jgi:hypothetical protein
MSNWSDDSRKLADFAEALTRAGVVEDTVEVIRKPYKFDDRYEIWAEMDFPGEEDANWDEFVEAITAENNDD